MSDQKYIEKAINELGEPSTLEQVEYVAQILEDKERLEAELKTFHEQGLQVYGRKIRVLNETIDRLEAELLRIDNFMSMLHRRDYQAYLEAKRGEV